MTMNGRHIYAMKNSAQKKERDRDKSRDWRACKSKIRYRSEGEAIHARKRIGEKRDTPLEIYFCGRCGGYHLTRNIDFK